MSCRMVSSSSFTNASGVRAFSKMRRAAAVVTSSFVLKDRIVETRISKGDAPLIEISVILGASQP